MFQEKGLQHALEEIIPGVDQRFCVRHLYNNFRKRHPGKQLKDLLWRAAKSTYTQAWERTMLEMKEINDAAYKELIRLPPRHWSKSRWSGNSVYEVNHIRHDDKFIVDLRARECNCRRWALTGIPCNHAVTCMIHVNESPDTYIPAIYRKQAYGNCYNPIIFPTCGKNMWETVQTNPLQPPPFKRQPGRPKKSRRKDPSEKDDIRMSRKGLKCKCSVCGATGHNKTTCPSKPPQEGTQTQQTPNSQNTTALKVRPKLRPRRKHT
ncbi:hypothetical protein RJT34_08056 [Clitoria ternatea]|uniref:SWIM-type domain-containing protein n=1 Tax=Clitoria ternatea TaxID=43366 RepID=A0AAN9PUC2_CLITE